MTKHELHKLAESKGVGFMIASKTLFFIFPGQIRTEFVTNETIERVLAMPDLSTKVVAIPDDAISLEGKTQEERDAAVLELMNKEN